MTLLFLHIRHHATAGSACETMQDHLTGKQYLGWKAIRDEQTRLQEQLANQRLPPPPSRPSEEARPSHRDREREREPRRERDRDRSHSSRDHHRSSDREPENGRRSSSHSHRERSPSRYASYSLSADGPVILAYFLQVSLVESCSLASCAICAASLASCAICAASLASCAICASQ